MKVLNIKKVLLFVCLIPCFLFSGCNNSLTTDRVRLDKHLENFVNSGVEHLKHTDKEKAYKEFSDVHGKFVEGVDYLFVYDFKGKCLAHGDNPAEYVGKNLLSYKDEFGVLVIKLLINVAKKGGGFVGYYWPNPKTGQQQFRIAYVKKLGNSTLIGASHPIPMD